MLYFQHKSSGTDLESNWLAAPDGLLGVVMRLYMPKEEVLSSAWKAPQISTPGPASKTSREGCQGLGIAIHPFCLRNHNRRITALK